MYYFCGNLFGNYDNYLTIKEKLKLKDTDELWILGNVLDSYDNSPEDSLQIITDIAKTPNIHLIIGEHEFNHIMYHVTIYDKEVHEAYKERLTGMMISGDQLLNYIENNSDVDDIESVFEFLGNDCELSNIIKIGDNYFYLIHGFPNMYNGNLTAWQIKATECEPPEEDVDFIPFIKSDPLIQNILKEEDLKNLNQNNTFVICSHKILDDLSGLQYKNGTFLLGENDPDIAICILGIDAAGWFIKKIIY